MSKSGVAVTVAARANAPVQCAFDVVAPIDLPRIFRGFGPLPAVLGTREQTGAWDHVGATRVVELGDGTEVREQLTAYEPPGRFAYRVDFLTGAVARLVDHADGVWSFEALPGGATRVVWTYTFGPRGRAGPLVRTIVAALWRAYARRALALAVAEVQREWRAEGSQPAG